MTDLSLPRTDRTVHGGEPGRTAQASDMPAHRRLWIADRPSIDVPCSIEIERTGDTLHAHVSLQGIEVDCGDEVLIHAAPTTIEFGGRLTTTSRATVIKAGPFRRWLTRIQSYLALTELYEVGFQPRSEIQFTSARSQPAPTAERNAP